MRNFSVVIERDPDTGLFVGFVPGVSKRTLPGGIAGLESKRRIA